MTTTATLGLLLLCLAGSGFFAGIETGIIAVNRLRLRHLMQHGVPGARIIDDFLRRPERLLGTTLIGTNICHVSIAVLSSSLALRSRLPHASLVVGALTTLVLLVFGEYLPKAWFQAFPARRTVPAARLLLAASWVLAPLRWLLAIVVRPLTRLSKATASESQPLLTREEFVHLTRESERSGILSPVETRMIGGVLRIGGIRCRDIMVPADKMASADQRAAVPDLLATARATGFSRFPVRDDRGQYVGIVNVYDVLADPDAERKTVNDFIRRPQFVAEYDLADHVMPRMRVTRQPLMLTTDTAGRVTGMVTLHDVMEVVFGRTEPPAAGRAGAP